jgi:hypothetical protein
MKDSNDFTSVPRHVKARRLFVDQAIDLNGRRQQAYAGMWVLEAVGGAGAQLLMPDDIFRMQFRPTDSAAESAWNEQTKNVWPQWPDGSPIDLH